MAAKSQIISAIYLAAIEMIGNLQKQGLTLAKWNEINQESLNRKFIDAFDKNIQKRNWSIKG